MSALTQQTNEWLELRKRKIGASDAPIIMQMSPWKTPYKLWEEKVGIADHTVVTKYMQEGIDREPEARDCFMKKTNILVEPRVVFHDKYEWMMASLDGIDSNKKHIVEIKNAGQNDHTIAKRGQVPDKYYPQLQHQLEVTGLDFAFYFSYNCGDGVIVEVGRDEAFIKKMLEEEKKFWVCMQDFIAPQMTKQDYIEVHDENFRKAIEEWKEIQKQMNTLTKRESILKTELINICEANDYTNVLCDNVRLSKCMRKGNIDYKSIEALKSLDLELFRKEPTHYWRVVNKK